MNKYLRFSALLLIAAVFGCSKAPPIADNRGGWIEKDCSECDGKGYVVYAADHEFVELNLAESGVRYKCSICGGIGKLDVQKHK